MTVKEKLSAVRDLGQLESICLDIALIDGTKDDAKEVVSWINERLSSGYYAYNKDVLSGLNSNKAVLLAFIGNK